MKRKIPAGFAVAASLLLSLCVAASGNALRKGTCATRRVVIDGRAFVPDESAPYGNSLLQRDLLGSGVRLPDGLGLPAATNPSHPAFSGRLKDSRRPPAREVLQLPAGWTAEHTLRMEGEGASVDLVFGRVGTPGPAVRSRLLSSGWKSLSSVEDPGGVHVLQSPDGKETAIACLDEAEGTFLLFREVGR